MLADRQASSPGDDVGPCLDPLWWHRAVPQRRARRKTCSVGPGPQRPTTFFHFGSASMSSTASTTDPEYVATGPPDQAMEGRWLTRGSILSDSPRIRTAQPAPGARGLTEWRAETYCRHLPRHAEANTACDPRSNWPSGDFGLGSRTAMFAWNTGTFIVPDRSSNSRETSRPMPLSPELQARRSATIVWQLASPEVEASHPPLRSSDNNRQDLPFWNRCVSRQHDHLAAETSIG